MKANFKFDKVNENLQCMHIHGARPDINNPGKCRENHVRKQGEHITNKGEGVYGAWVPTRASPLLRGICE